MTMTNDKKPRFTHYASYASQWAFKCYRAEMTTHLNSEIGKSEFGATIYSLPQPKCRTDLRDVDCPQCWQAIQTMCNNKEQTHDK